MSQNLDEINRFSDQILLDLTLKKAASMTELLYWISILPKSDLSQSSLNEIFQRGLLTIKCQQIKLGIQIKTPQKCNTY